MANSGLARSDLTEMPSWRSARDAAATAGWSLLATGDWSWVYGHPRREVVWRITPFDPAFDLFAELCRTETSPHLPTLVATHQHGSGGTSTIMERLLPVSTETAEGWLADLGAAKTGELARVRDLLERAAATTDLPLFAGLDTSPANVMRRPADHALVFIDAFWVNGRELLDLIGNDPAAAVRLFGIADLAEWAHLPCMDAATTERILSQLHDT